MRAQDLLAILWLPVNAAKAIAAVVYLIVWPLLTAEADECYVRLGGAPRLVIGQ